jgi:hypothetical protein
MLNLFNFYVYGCNIKILCIFNYDIYLYILFVFFILCDF